MKLNEKIGSYEAKSKLPEILRRVGSGHRFTITNHGKAIADLIPTQTRSQKNVESAIRNILKLEKPLVSDSELTDFREQGRK